MIHSWVWQAVLRCLLLFSLLLAASNSLADTSQDLINDGNWNGAVYGPDPGGCCASISGGGPLYDTTTDTIMFSYGRSILEQTIAINQALQLSGIEVSGYNYEWEWRRISNNGRGGDTLHFEVLVRDAAGNAVESYIYDYSYQGVDDVWYSESGQQLFNRSYLDPQSIALRIQGQDGGYWGGYYGPEVRNIGLTLEYTANPCAADPLYDPSCPGYAAAYAQQQYDLNCSANPLYDSGCPGYQQAYLTQQCNANALYDPSCPGYAGAYYDQQCSIDPLYDSGCPGYATAYFDQQCSADPFYDTSCPRYAQAYYDQQCSLNALYDSGCSGYTQAYYDQQCSINALYDTGCPGYQQAFYDQQCGLNALYDSGCSGYAKAYYDQQCSINALYDTGCPGYAKAYYDNQCSLNPLYDTGCTGYANAYFSQQCGLDALYDSQCPGYATAYYNQQCGLDALYDSGCTGYQEKYFATYIQPELERQAQAAAGTTTEDAATPTSTTIAATAEDPVAALTATPATGDATVDQILRETADVSTTIGVPGMVETTPPATSPVPEASTTAEAETSTASEPSAEAELEAELASLDDGGSNEEEVSESSDNVDESSDEGSDGEGNGESRDRDSGKDSKDQKSEKSPEQQKRDKLKEIATQRAMMLAETMGQAASLEQQQAVQAQIAALINFVPGFNAYGQVGIPGGDVYADQPFYEDKQVPENQRGLRQGLAQQILHEKMVEQQYENLQ